VIVPQNCTTQTTDSQNTKIVINDYSWSVELWWKVNRHISLDCYYIAWSFICTLNSKSRSLSRVYFHTLQKKLSGTYSNEVILSFHKLKYICYSGKRKCAIAADSMYIWVWLWMSFFQVF
jgi:hypothetical protein